jgi:hypothetical protein
MVVFFSMGGLLDLVTEEPLGGCMFVDFFTSAGDDGFISMGISTSVLDCGCISV